jgi:hypothetical protein
LAGVASCFIPLVGEAVCGIIGEAELGGGVTAMGALGVAGAVGGEAAVNLTDAIGLDTKALDAEQAESDAIAACGNSFVASTPVLMANGATKPIDQVKVGDKITNAQPDSSKTQTDTVTAVHITYTDHDYDQLTITADGPKTITSTAEHLYWDTTTHAWTAADNLNVGDQLDTPGNDHATILATKHYTAFQTTYNLTIDTTHTYYVEAGTTPVLAHNCDGDINWVPENANMSSSARAYDSGAVGSRDGYAPALQYYQADSDTISTIKFDGFDEGNGTLIDRKVAVTTFPKTYRQAINQSMALEQNGYTGLWEVPNAAQATRAQGIFDQLNITNIQVRIVSP